MKREMSRAKLEKYIKFKQELEKMKYELLGIEPKNDRNTLVLKRK